ncbi:hypothetical protein [[Ruminococcus] torques]|uniref:hypothetical protein n=1 Tax=[Ruminococcus] torques TaxID=33039 RepID=UPI002666DB0E|nr:hypothetical protein [[Ruminococcus] torques]
MKKKRCLSVVIISLLLGISCFIMAGCANKDNEDKDDTKIEQNLDKKEDAEDFNKKDEEADENKKVEEDEDEDENSREARVYYVDDITGEIMGKTITVKTEYDIWKALQGNGILTEGCQLLSFKVNEETHLIDLDFNAATGEYIRSMGTTGEIQIIGCIINTYLETYDCDGIKLTEEGKVLQTSHGDQL